MFDFGKLDVYKKAKAFNSDIREFIRTTKLDNTTNDQLRRAAFSIVLNLAEGSGRLVNPIENIKVRSWFFVNSRLCRTYIAPRTVND